MSFAFVDSSTPFLVQALVLLGFFLWLVTYYLIIRKCFQDKTYGVPWPSIFLNLSWELYMGLFCPASGGSACSFCPGSTPACGQGGLEGLITLTLWLIRGWLALDLVILWQFLRYGRNEQPEPLRRFFYLLIFTFFLFALIGIPQFIWYNSDTNGLEASWILNAVMSILFLQLFFSRPHLKGLSYPAAWTKMLGSLVMVPALPPPAKMEWFLYLLAAITFFSDLAYVSLMTSRRMALAKGLRGEELRAAGGILA